MVNRLILGAGLMMLLPALALAEDWTQFRGPAGGVSSESKLPSEWGSDKNIAWKATVPGVAWSQPIVVGDKVFVTTAVTDKQTKPSAGRGGFGGGGFGRGGRGGAPDVNYRWEVHCLDRSTGKVLWKELAVEKRPTIPKHSTNTYATETPVSDGERVYAYFGMIGLFCYDLEGKLLWKKDLGSYPMMAGWGTGSSPALDSERVFIQCDNEQKSFLVALDKKTGKELWRADREAGSSWSSPYVWKNKKRTEVITGSSKIQSYDPATGKVLWEIGGSGGRSSATPVGDDELLYVGKGGSSRFGRGGFGRRPRGNDDDDNSMGSGGPLFAVRAGASGDITLKSGETSNEGIAWSQSKGGPSTPSPVLYQGKVYVLGRGVLNCYDAKTGKPVYERERITGAGGFTSSPWAYDSKIFCLDENGRTFVIKAGEKFEILAKNTLDEMFWSSPAVSGGSLFLRGVEHLYCIKP